MEIIKIKCYDSDKEHVVIFGKNGMKFENFRIPYFNLLSITLQNDYEIFYADDELNYCSIKTTTSTEKVLKGITVASYTLFKNTFEKYYDKWLLGEETTSNEILTRLNDIEQKLDDLFYAPGLTGYHEAKEDFEKSILML